MTKPVLLVRANSNPADAHALAQVGLESVSDSYLTIKPLQGAAGYTAATKLLDALTALSVGDWVIATSANGLSAWGELYGISNLKAAFAAAAERGIRFAAIGPATSRKYSAFGIEATLVADLPYGPALADQLIASSTPATALVPSGNLALSGLSDGLSAAGWNVESVVCYSTETVSEIPESAQALRNAEFSAVVLRSPSAARAVAHHAGTIATPVICGGQTTATEARSLGLNVAGVAEGTASEQIAQAVFDAIQTTLQGAK